MFRLNLAFVSTIFALIYALSGCGASQQSTNPSHGCSSGIEYQNKSFSLDASYKLIGLSANSESKVVREVSDAMKIYFDEAANLCSLYERGDMEGNEYADRREELSMRFAALVALNNAAPASKISEDEAPLYLETVSALKKKASSTPLELGLTVQSKGQVIKSGSQLKSGDGFRISVDVPQRSFLYIVLIDSQGDTSRLYPTELTGTENPVEGTVHVPADPGAEFSLDANSGEERILVFAQQQRSHAIETTLGAVTMEGQAQNSGPTRALTRGIVVRQSVQGMSDLDAGRVASVFGMAGMEFVINHN